MPAAAVIREVQVYYAGNRLSRCRRLIARHRSGLLGKEQSNASICLGYPVVKTPDEPGIDVVAWNSGQRSGLDTRVVGASNEYGCKKALYYAW